MLLEIFEKSIIDGQVLWPLLLALIAGFLTSLSPCVYPLIPITLTIMGTQRHDNHLQGFVIALSYVSGMSLVYCVLGAIFASIGLVVGSFMQQPLMLLVVAALFMLMAASLFGIVDVVIPQRMLTRLSAVGGQGKRGAFLMGLVAGVLAAPCTGPVLGFILTLIANRSDVVQGSLLMLAFSVGIGAPFLILGTFFQAVTRLPKSGPWMDNVKNFFAAIILGTAWYYVSLVWLPLHDALTTMRGFGLSIVVIALLVGIIILIAGNKINSRTLFVFKHILGALLASSAVAALLTFDGGALEISASADLDWHVVDDKRGDTQAFERLLAQAKKDQRPVLIDFYADWCVACKQLELLTFRNHDVINELKRFMLIRVDATTSSSTITSIENQFRVIGLPTIVLIDESGEVSATRILGFMPPEQFLPLIKNP